MAGAGTLFLYLGSKVRNDANCTDEVKLRMAMGNKLTKMWKNKSLSTVTKLRLMKAVVCPVMSCEAWTLKLEEEKRIQASEIKCTRKLLRIPWTKLMTTEHVYKMAGTERKQTAESH